MIEILAPKLSRVISIEVWFSLAGLQDLLLLAPCKLSTDVIRLVDWRCRNDWWHFLFSDPELAVVFGRSFAAGLAVAPGEVFRVQAPLRCEALL